MKITLRFLVGVVFVWGLMHSTAWAREPVASWHFDAELNVPGNEGANVSIETIQSGS